MHIMSTENYAILGHALIKIFRSEIFNQIFNLNNVSGHVGNFRV